ncbi:hypothetical protein [Commensalibacter sp. Nvir]|uniref:hypothetical protein n=1 Tax=Commensalibacter sp. Nvir TaxID=3069817 RepID=UPI0030C7CEC8
MSNKIDANFAENFVRDRLTLLANQAAEAGLSVDVFEALLIALADELDFKAIFLNRKGKNFEHGSL